MTQDELNGCLVESIQQLDVAEVERLLSEGANPNTIAYGRSIDSYLVIDYVIHNVVRLDPYAVELLFEEANLDLETYNIRPEVEPIILALIEKGVNPNLRIRGRIPLISKLAGYGWDTCVLSLIRHGADVRAIDTISQMTPLHCALRSCSLETIKALVESGADVNADMGMAGITILGDAKGFKRQDVVDYLRSQGSHSWSEVSS